MINIAVLTLNIPKTFKWIQDNYEVDQIRFSHKIIYLKNGAIMKLVNNIENIRGIEWHEVIISPFYTDLRMEIDCNMRR